MANVNLSSLRQLFVDQNRMDVWPQVKQMLEHWVRVAQSGGLSLKPEGEIDAERYASAVAAATGREVTEVIFVSLSEPFPRPKWMSEEAYKKSLRDSLGDSLGDSFWDSLGDSLGDSLWVSIFYGVGFALAGDEEKFAAMRELLAVQEQALDLGFHKDDAKVFLALCA